MNGYALIGKEVTVQLYNRAGIVIGTVTGRVSDFAPDAEVAEGMKKDLILLTGVEDYDSPHLDEGGELWCATSDIIKTEGEMPNFMAN